MSTQNKSFFFTVVPASDRFLSGDEPTEQIMRDFADSVAMKLEVGDTASDSQQGLVESATQTEYDNGVDSNGVGYSLYVRPSFIKTALTTLETLLQTQITAIQNDIVSIQNSITTITNDITTIQNDINTINNEITNITTIIGDSMPVGAIVMYPVGTAPNADWLVCEGQVVLTADYPLLFNVIGYSFGGGAGNMQLPDMRQKFIAGYDQLAAPDYNVIGSGAGENEVTLTGQESGVAQHDHAIGAAASASLSAAADAASANVQLKTASTNGGGSGSTPVCNRSGDYTRIRVGADNDYCGGDRSQLFTDTHAHSITGTVSLSGDTDMIANTDAANPHENRPEFIVFPYFIKAK